jgi:ketosteroid isomerase-like protein
MSTTWEAEVRACEEKNRIAFLEADIPTLRGLWSDDFLVNSPRNEVNDKERLFELLEAGRIRHTSFTAEIEHVVRHGDVVVVMGGDRVTDPPDGTVSHRRFTNLWRLEAGSWRCFARHANVFRREEASRELGKTAT